MTVVVVAEKPSVVRGRQVQALRMSAELLVLRGRARHWLRMMMRSTAGAEVFSPSLTTKCTSVGSERLASQE